jgi:hypothetical protein
VRKQFKLWLGAAAVLGIVSLLAVAIILASLEGYLRYVIPPSSDEPIFEYTLETKRFKVMKANASVIAFGVPLNTNNLGFRSDRPYLPAKEPDEYRIVVLGDSFTVAAGVPVAEIFTSRLERTLRQDRPEVRVLNLAVGGYNLVQYDLVLNEVGLGLSPDLVLIALYPFNDFWNSDYEENRRVALGGKIHDPWYSRSLAYQAYVSKLIHFAGQVFSAPSAGDQATTDVAARENTEALRRILDTTKARNIPTVVAALPTTSAPPLQASVFATFDTLCKELGASCVSLIEPFIRSDRNPRTMRLNQVDAHPNAEYQAIVADALAAHLAPLLGRR